MDVGDCYRLLGLRLGASCADVKASYRRLAQQYHPDINPGDIKAKEKFIALTEAYKLLLQLVPQEERVKEPSSSNFSAAATQQVATKAQTKTQEERTNKHRPQKPRPEPAKKVAVKEKVTVKEEAPKPQPKPPNIQEIEQRLKWKTYEQLQHFLKDRRFPQAIALAEALNERLPEDIEVRQWLAISYQLWGRTLIAQKQMLKARIYLKKALKTDPNNKTLWNEVQRDFQKLEQTF